MRTIQWGILGTADIARGQVIPGMQLAENAALGAIAGRSLEKAEQFQREFGFEKAYGSYDALLADPAIEAIYNPLPNDLHHEWTIKALRAGKHVLCEKPLAPSVREIEEMQRAAEESGVLLMEAFAYLHSPILPALKAELDAGAIGTVRLVESTFFTSDYDLSNIRMRRENFGGCTFDLGCYCVSQILSLLGEEPEDVRAVAQFSPEGVDTLTQALLRFPSGARAALQCGMALATGQHKRVDRLRVYGAKGVLRSDVEFNQKGTLRYTVEHDDGRIEEKAVEAQQNYALEVEQMGRCIAEGEALGVSPAFSLATGRVLERILKEIGY